MRFQLNNPPPKKRKVRNPNPLFQVSTLQLPVFGKFIMSCDVWCCGCHGSQLTGQQPSCFVHGTSPSRTPILRLDVARYLLPGPVPISSCEQAPRCHYRGSDKQRGVRVHVSQWFHKMMQAPNIPSSLNERVTKWKIIYNGVINNSSYNYRKLLECT
jgi:hypothetical protein